MASQKAVSGSDRLRDEPRAKRKKITKVSATAVTSAAAVAEDSSAENAESATATTEDGKPTLEPTTSQKAVSGSDRLRDEPRAKRKKVAKVSPTAVTSAAAVAEDSSAENAESVTGTTEDGKPTVEPTTSQKAVSGSDRLRDEPRAKRNLLISADREHVDDHQEELPAGHDQPTGESSVQQGNCSNCGVLSNTIRKLKNRIVSLEKNVRKWKTSNRRSEYQLKGKSFFCVYVLMKACFENVIEFYLFMVKNDRIFG